MPSPRRALQPLGQPAVVREAAMTPTQDRWSAVPWRVLGRREQLFATVRSSASSSRGYSRRGGFFDGLFGSDSGWDRPRDTYRTVCVRMCDGYYFPVSFSVTPDRFERDRQSCENSCGAAGPAVRLSQSRRRARGHAGSAGAALSAAAHGVPLSHRVRGRLQVQAASLGAAGQGPASRLCARRRQAQGRQGGRSRTRPSWRRRCASPQAKRGRPRRPAGRRDGNRCARSGEAGRRAARNAASEAELMRLGAQRAQGSPRAGADAARQQRECATGRGDLWRARTDAGGLARILSLPFSKNWQSRTHNRTCVRRSTWRWVGRRWRCALLWALLVVADGRAWRRSAAHAQGFFQYLLRRPPQYYPPPRPYLGAGRYNPYQSYERSALTTAATPIARSACDVRRLLLPDQLLDHAQRVRARRRQVHGQLRQRSAPVLPSQSRRRRSRTWST